MAWINLANMLSKEPGVEARDIEPFISRSHEGEGTSRWEFGPNGMELTEQESMRLEWRSVPRDAIRLVESPEARYTLAQAKELLLHQALMAAANHDRAEDDKPPEATSGQRDGW